ncbi:hypothetical protein CDL15_Pgr024830 [Punica granatum]|uniref:Uncharacterized protein n=1 Tax=Punica granatum TaxID=22663 RepID=A0A218WJT3_PUNGR|nr:hypothetical protein CDL15_Pgr024830 [Punica granatum]
MGKVEMMTVSVQHRSSMIRVEKPKIGSGVRFSSEEILGMIVDFVPSEVSGSIRSDLVGSGLSSRSESELTQSVRIRPRSS